MANPEHVALFQQGSTIWNTWKWSKECPPDGPDLSEINLAGIPCDRDFDLTRTDLRGANLSFATFPWVYLVEANLQDACLRYIELSGDLGNTNLRRANLTGANLHGAILNGSDLGDADLSGADLSGVVLTCANLTGANLRGANLRGAHLCGTNLSFANLSGTHLENTDFSSIQSYPTLMQYTQLGELDLHSATGLETIRHLGPSLLSINTWFLSRGKLPAAFLQGTGAPTPLSFSSHSLATQPIKYESCVIYCDHTDQAFARQLSDDLQSHGVRTWRWSDDLYLVDDDCQQRMDAEIGFHSQFVIVLGEYSVWCTWFKKIVTMVLQMHQGHKRPPVVLVRLDDTMERLQEPWFLDLCRLCPPIDFRGRTDLDAYQESVQRLLQVLEAKLAGDPF